MTGVDVIVCRSVCTVGWWATIPTVDRRRVLVLAAEHQTYGEARTWRFGFVDAAAGDPKAPVMRSLREHRAYDVGFAAGLLLRSESLRIC